MPSYGNGGRTSSHRIRPRRVKESLEDLEASLRIRLLFKVSGPPPPLGGGHPRSLCVRLKAGKKIRPLFWADSLPLFLGSSRTPPGGTLRVGPDRTPPPGFAKKPATDQPQLRTRPPHPRLRPHAPRCPVALIPIVDMH